MDGSARLPSSFAYTGFDVIESGNVLVLDLSPQFGDRWISVLQRILGCLGFGNCQSRHDGIIPTEIVVSASNIRWHGMLQS